MTTFKKGQVIFLLDTNPSIPPSKDNPGIFELTVKERNGKLIAIGKDGRFTINFDLSNVARYEADVLFATREEAVAAYEASVAREIDAYQNQSKEDFFMDFYHGCINEFNADPRVIDAIKTKVKADFGIDVDQY